MSVVSVPIAAPGGETIAEAARLIREGRLVAFPTETVYGLGADATNATAVAHVYTVKRRPRYSAMNVLVPDTAAARAIGDLDARAEKLAAAFLPGPLTLVVPRSPACPVAPIVSNGLDRIGIRIPDHPVALALLRAVGRPIAAPSANPSGAVSPTTAAHVAQGLGDAVDMILDGGPCQVGVESTVIDLDGGEVAILRPGGIGRSAIEALIGPVATAPTTASRHYAPSRRLRLNATEVAPDEALLAFGPHWFTEFSEALNLSESGDLSEAASNLFAMLRALDGPAATAIAVMPVPDTGLGEAINDRLRRAAAPG